MKTPKFKIHDSGERKGNTGSANATAVGITAEGRRAYEWDSRVTHPATEESLTKIN